jgi:hypothetical protein
MTKSKPRPRRNPAKGIAPHLQPRLDPRVLDASTRLVAAAAREGGVKLALIGGLAMQVWGSPRFTGDLDFIGDGEDVGIGHSRPLAIGGVSGTAGGIDVDVIVPSLSDYEELYDAALHAARPVKNVSVPVVPPEYLVALKMLAMRAKDELDIDYLIRSGAADPAATRKIVRKHLGADRVDDFESMRQMVAVTPDPYGEPVRANPTPRKRAVRR